MQRDSDKVSDTAIIMRALRRVEDVLHEMQPPSGAPRLLSIPEVAESLGVSPDTVKRLCDRRELPYVQARAGAAKRIPLDGLHRWIDEHTTRPIAR